MCYSVYEGQTRQALPPELIIPAFREGLERTLIITAGVRPMSSNGTFDGELSQGDALRSRVRVTRRNETRSALNGWGKLPSLATLAGRRSVCIGMASAP